MKKMFNLLFASAVALMCFSAAYAEDGYLESEGEARICLVHFIGPNTKLEVDFQLTEVAADTRPFGSWGNNTSVPMFSLIVNGSKDFVWTCSAGDANLGAADLKRHVVSFDSTTRTCVATNVTDGGAASTTTLSGTISSLKSKYSLSMFSRLGEDSAVIPSDFYGPTKMKVYGAKVYESGTLVKTYTPCLKGGVPGFRVSGPNIESFVTGVDISKVKYGGDIAIVKDDPYLSTGDYNDITTNSVVGKCIYFDTGYVVKPTSRVELDFASLTPNIPMSGYNHAPEFMYAQGSNRNEMEIVGRTSTGYLGYKLGTSAYSNFKAPLDISYNIRRTISITSNTLVMVTAGYTNSVDTVSAAQAINTDLSNVKLQLGTATEGNYFAPMKIYGLKIYESDVLVKDYRPTVTNGVSGLVDVANPEDSPRYAITYGHSNPRLMFEAGGDIACTDGSDEAYLEFNGTYIDTGCTVASNSCVEADLSFREVNNGEGQYVLWQEPAVNSGVVAYLYISGDTDQHFNYRFADCNNYSGWPTGVRVSNARRQFTLDGPNYKMTIRRGGEVEYDLPLAEGQGSLTRVDGGSATMKIGNSKNHMRLYRFKVTTGGALVRDFVPYSTNGVAGLYDLCGKRFYPLEGGKVSGAKSKGVAFQIEPQPMTLKQIEARSTGTLTCLAAGAQSYEWYENGVLMPGEKSDSLTLEWSEAKARSASNTYTYSVKPVYTVFNERVVGDAATTTVEYRAPLGMTIFIR
ncbi:MAG: hypothetical protein IJH50_12080 [Kiritimatiellae bacterium]|nr:hypothetical protein [Kiritimatiellia bacterium]